MWLICTTCSYHPFSISLALGCSQMLQDACIDTVTIQQHKMISNISGCLLSTPGSPETYQRLEYPCEKGKCSLARGLQSTVIIVNNTHIHRGAQTPLHQNRPDHIHSELLQAVFQEWSANAKGACNKSHKSNVSKWQRNTCVSNLAHLARSQPNPRSLPFSAGTMIIVSKDGTEGKEGQTARCISINATATIVHLK